MASPDRPSTAYRRRVLDEFLSCNICKKPYTRPKFLPCHHYFCQECLEVSHGQWLETCERAERPDSDLFRCPDCGQPVSLPTEGIAGLLDNQLVAKLCEEFSKKTSVTPANTQVGRQKNRCSFHPQEEIKLYCLESACKVPVCNECIIHSHKGHQITGVGDEAKQIRNNIMAELDTGREKMETFSAFLREIKEFQKRLMDNKVQTQQDIEKACKVQVKKIEDQRDKLLDTLEKSFEDNMAALEKQHNQVLTQLAELSRVCERTEQCMEQEEVVWLSQDLNVAQTLKEKFQNVQTPEICEVKHCSFEAKKSVTLIELGKVTTKPMSNKQSVCQSKQTSSGEVTSTKVRPIRVGQPWVEKVRFGGRGSGRGEFSGPLGVAVSHDNEVYIADYGNSRIQVFTIDGVYIREFTTTLPGETGKALQPEDVAVDGNDNLWVVGGDHVVQYSREGTCLATIDLPHVIYFRGITVAMAREQVIVTEYDGQNGRLRVFNQDGSEVGTYGSGHRSPEPWLPCYVTVDGEGNILVTDDNNHCVHVLDREGNFKFKFGSEGSDESQLKDPLGICVDGMGNIIVADYGNSCVKMFDSQGRFLCYIGSGMNYPRGVTVSPGGDVVVTHWKDHTVSLWTQD
ncbi:E3 ubiquitin-protein ligase TRIM32-like [Branchiostoma floridae x Branchiostoma belcheri]